MSVGIVVLALLFIVAVLGLALYGGHIKRGMDAISLYRVASCLVLASILTGVISLACLYLALPAIKNDFTHHDALIDILGVLVTVLMGWNIISVVDFKKKAESVDHISDDFSHVISGIMELNMNSFMMAGEKVVLLDNSFNTLEAILKCQNDSIRIKAVDEIMELIKKICDAMKKNKENSVLAGRRDQYKFLLDHVDSANKEKILEFIDNAEDCEAKGPSQFNHIDPNDERLKDIGAQGNGVNSSGFTIQAGAKQV